MIGDGRRRTTTRVRRPSLVIGATFSALAGGIVACSASTHAPDGLIRAASSALSPTPQASETAAVQPATSTSAPAVTTSTARSTAETTSQVAHVGDTFRLAGQPPDRVDVTLLQISPKVAITAGYDPAQTGDRYFAAKFQLVNSGTGAYRDNITGDSVVLDAAGNDYNQALALNVAVSPQFSASTTHIQLDPGQSDIGWILYEVPIATVVTTVQFFPDDGDGQAGQWSVP